MASRRLCVAILLLVTGTAAYFRRPPYPKGGRPELWMSTSKLITGRGYRPESHEVRTADGYLLGLQRVAARRPRPEPTRGRGTPVLLGHGMASNSEQWVLRGDSLAFALVDLGFDVWLVNYRGSFYSRRHITLSEKSAQFWNFSWHESGVHDQPAIIDYVLTVTGRPALLTVGHSMSSTVQLVLLAERPEYSSKVLASVIMAPPALFHRTVGFSEAADRVLRHFPHARDTALRFLKRDSTLAAPSSIPFCYMSGLGKPPSPSCTLVMDFIFGEPFMPLNLTYFQIFMAHWPEKASGGQYLHSAQNFRLGGNFYKFDYGPFKNKELYGSVSPPVYNLSSISSPTYVYYSMTDNTVHYKDVEDLAKLLPSLKRLHRVFGDTFNHVDFFISSVAYERVYMHVIQDLLRHV
ncbi:lipase 1-like [Frankliniella occidentalis]|uniref:Lipase n=1 Tax=Frankliniella occidentalis TaxID=133901 RepID=A0A6J1RTH7_FRAOC|nr:lipase 1-like [Frankliniella occidentalis]